MTHGTRKEPDLTNLSGLLDTISGKFESVPDDTQVTVGELLDVVGHRAYGPLLLFIGLFSISPPSFITGVTWFSATLILLIAAQMAVGRRTPWIPGGMKRVSLSRRLLFKGIDAMKPWARSVDWILKPRLSFLTRWPFIVVVALFTIAIALTMYPLGFIPFAPFFPGIVIVFLGLGITARDGLVLILGPVLVFGTGWLVYQSWW